MYLKTVPFLALLLASKASALALPQDDGTTTSVDDDYYAAIDAALAVVPPVVDAPPANVSFTTPPPDADADASAAAADSIAASEAANSDGSDDSGDAPQKRATPAAGCTQQAASPFTPTGGANSLSADQWLAQDQFHTPAINASTPSGYKPVTGYKNLYASAQMPSQTDTGVNVLAGTYSGLKSYDVAGCAAQCDATSGCVSFVIYFERSPLYHVNSQTCPGGPGQTYSAAQTFVRCVMYRQPVTVDRAQNTGSSPGGFLDRIAGANAYQTSQYPYIDGFNEAIDLGDSAIKVTSETTGTYLRAQTLSGVYSPANCAAACLAHNSYTDRHPSNGYCNFFDVYWVTRSDVAGGTLTCTFWTQTWGLPQATNPGQTRGGVTYKNTMSLGYALAQPHVPARPSS